jgi:S-adenosylmethionine:tRNA ribosyltransferase-isomerase
MNLTLADFDYTLPPELIAKRPITPRDHARVLVTTPDALDDRHIYDLPQLLRPGDLLVFNDTKVIPARLIGTVGAAQIEILLHRAVGGAAEPDNAPRITNSKEIRGASSPTGDAAARAAEQKNIWEVMARPGKKLKLGVVVDFSGLLSATVIGKDETHGTYFLRFDQGAQEFWDGLQRIGTMPIPPYFERDGDTQDVTDYQSQFAQHAGAVAAPTASLHFTPELLARLAAAGINTTTITLHVGAGTFMPVRVDNIADHVMHQEWCQISQTAADTINQTRQRGGRVIAVGTTVARTLETAAGDDGTIRPIAQDTQIFITPGYKFRAIDGMVTNFHLPQSTLLMMVSALMGMERIKTAYAHAITAQYRFYSYGDSMLLWPRN